MKYQSRLNEYIAQANTPKKKRVLEKIRAILKFVLDSNLDGADIKELEQELESYNLSKHQIMSNRSVNGKFRLLQRFVNKKYKFTHKGYFTSYFMALGMMFGLSIGSTLFDPKTGLSAGMMIGLFVGSLIGRIKDQKAEKNQLVYKL